LQNYSPDLLRYYLEVEQPSFVNRSAGVDLSNFGPLWNKLSWFERTVSGSYPGT
jgi:hypothetical protein